MNLKYLLVPLIAFALGTLSPVTLAKGHSKSSRGEHKHKSYKKHERKQHHENSHKQSDDNRSYSRKHAEEPHVNPNKKHDCNGKNCIKSHASKGLAAPLPQPPKVAAHLPAPPKANVHASRLPASPVNALIDQTAHQAKQKAGERGQ